MSERVEISYSDLYCEYITNQKTIEQCAYHFGCSRNTIFERLKAHNIPTRKRGPISNSQLRETPEAPTPELEGQEPEGQKSNGQTPLQNTNSGKRMLERLMLFSAISGKSIQEIIEEALELFFQQESK